MKLFRQLYHWCAAPERLFAITITVLLLPNAALCLTERLPWAGRVCNILLPSGAYWLAMTLSRRPGRMIWALSVLIFFAAFQLVLLYLFGHSIIAVDMFLNLVTTNPGEAMELLDNLVPAVAGVFIIYLPVLIAGGVSAFGHDSLSSRFIRRQRRLALAVTGAGAVSLGVCYATDSRYSVKTDLYPVNVCYNLFLAVERAGATADYAATSAGFTFKARPTHPADSTEVYVMVIGETARACNFGLYGYRRNTTPQLDSARGIVAFSDVITQSNTTHKSVPMLMSAASAENYSRIYREKSIITAFREAGFHTVFISNQRPNHSFIDFFGMEADEWKFIKEDAPEDAIIPDDALIKLTEDVLSAKRKKEFIVLHTYGSHFNYRERYPDSMSYYRPDNATDAKYSNRASLMNAYDNTIRNTDRLLGSLIARLTESGATAAILYTSDHGENIFDDDRRLFLHASPIPSYYELHVPFIVWLSDAYSRLAAGECEALRRNSRRSVASSASVFHTLLGMAGISTPYRNDTLSVASQLYRSAERHYLNDHNLPVPVSEIVTDEEDVRMFRHMGVAYP